MEAQDIALKLSEHDMILKSLDAQLKKVEDQQKAIQELTLSVHDLARGLTDMVEEQKKTDERLKTLEKAPTEKWNTISRSVVTAIISVVVGAVTTGLIWAIVNNIK